MQLICIVFFISIHRLVVAKQLQSYHPATIANAMIGIVDDAVLARSDALDFFFRFNQVRIAVFVQFTRRKLGRMANFKGNVYGFGDVAPWVFGNKVEVVQGHFFAVLSLHIVTLRYVHHVFLGIFSHHVPWPTAQAQTLALSNGMEPKAVVFAQYFARFKLYNLTLLGA